MSDRPEYGEFASPEEQRKHVRQPLPDLDQPPAGYGPLEPRQPRQPVAATGAPRQGDRIATWVLLGIGLVNVLFTAPGYFGLAEQFAVVFEILGIGEFTNIAQAQSQGPLAAIALIVGFALTLWLSVRRLRTGKLTWWLPIVGAVVTNIAVYMILSPVFTNDPAFMEYVLRGIPA